MATETWLDGRLKKATGNATYETERLILHVGEQIYQAMEDQNVSRADLSRALGVTKGYVSRVLNQTPNVTLRTLVSIATVLGYRVSLSMTRVNATQVDTVSNFERYLTRRQSFCDDDSRTLFEGFEQFVPPVPKNEKQHAAA